MPKTKDKGVTSEILPDERRIIFNPDHFLKLTSTGLPIPDGSVLRLVKVGGDLYGLEIVQVSTTKLHS